jgi:hypothetical protein
VARIYANENFPLEVVRALRRSGHDVLTFAEAGNSGLAIPDEQVLAFASHEDRALLTLNRWDFVRLHGLEPKHAGIIVCSLDQDADGQAARIDNAIKVAGDLNGKLIRVNRPS